MEFNVYAVICILSILMLILLIRVGHRQNITDYLVIFGLIMISCVGYYIVSCAETLETAIVGQQIIYLGGVFIPVFLLFGTMKLCKIKVPKFFAGLLFIWCMAILCLIFTIENNDLYYTKMFLIEDYGMTYLEVEYGAFHILYIAFLAFNMIAMAGIIFYAMIKKRNISYKVTSTLLTAEVITISLYFIRIIMHDTFEWFTVAYIFDEILILILIKRICMYDVSESVAKALDENSSYGYIVLDKDLRYLSSNDMAEEYLSEIKTLKVDSIVTKENAPILIEKFGHWIANPNDKTAVCIIEENGKYIKATIKHLLNEKNHKLVGYYIELEDDTAQQKYMLLINNYSDNLEKEVREQTAHINKMQDKIVLGMADMVENRDNNTGGHIKRTSEVVRIFTNELILHSSEYDFTNEFLEYVVKAAPMHDLGKIAVDDSVLRKPGKYTPEEFNEMKKHSEKGAEIVTQILEGVNDENFVDIARNVAHYHHEKWNGEGYPQQLSGVGIPVEARIMALADVFDALVSKRCYKDKMSYDKAFNIIEESLGSHFDPDLGSVFLKCRPQLEAFYDSLEQ